MLAPTKCLHQQEARLSMEFRGAQKKSSRHEISGRQAQMSQEQRYNPG